MPGAHSDTASATETSRPRPHMFDSDAGTLTVNKNSALLGVGQWEDWPATLADLRAAGQNASVRIEGMDPNNFERS